MFYICRMKNLTLAEKIIAIFLLVTIIFGLYIYATHSAKFDFLVQEDGFYENLTSIFLFLSSLTLFFKFFIYQKFHGIYWKVGILLMAVALFFGGGEEISWGQRIFDVQSSDFFKQNNAQEETNLHNMVVDGVKLNKIIFSNLMSIAFGIYFLIVPILWKKSAKLKALIDKFGISVPRPIHVIGFVVITLLILIPVQHSRKWEMWEYVFALVMFLIVYNPWNTAEIFSKNQLQEVG